jgi:phosphoglycolate phosphatase
VVSPNGNDMKLIIFDVDGTLVDSRNLIREAQRRVFTRHGLTPPVGDQGLSVIGLSLRVAFQQLAGPDAPLDAMVTHYQASLPHLRTDPAYAERPFAGADQLLNDLSTWPGVRLGVATGHQRDGLTPLIDQFNWAHLFCTLQTADVALSKPHPGMILQAMAEAQVSAADTMMIGDTTFDLDMANAAGVAGIAVTWGYHAEDRLRSTKPRFIARSMDDLRQHLVSWSQ